MQITVKGQEWRGGGEALRQTLPFLPSSQIPLPPFPSAAQVPESSTWGRRSWKNSKKKTYKNRLSYCLQPLTFCLDFFYFVYFSFFPPPTSKRHNSWAGRQTDTRTYIILGRQRHTHTQTDTRRNTLPIGHLQTGPSLSLSLPSHTHFTSPSTPPPPPSPRHFQPNLFSAASMFFPMLLHHTLPPYLIPMLTYVRVPLYFPFSPFISFFLSSFPFSHSLSAGPFLSYLRDLSLSNESLKRHLSKITWREYSGVAWRF